MKIIFDELKQGIRDWWVPFILSTLYAVVALGLMFFLSDGYAALSILSDTSMLVGGLSEVSSVASNHQGISSRGWYLAEGIIDMILRFYPIAYPLLNMKVVPSIVTFQLMFRGFPSVGYVMDLGRYGAKNWGWYIVFGVLTIICSLVILWQPVVGAIYTAYIISSAFLTIEFFHIMLSFELENLHKRGL